FRSSSSSFPFKTISSTPKLSMKNLRYSNPNLASLSGYSTTTFSTFPLLILFKSFCSPLLFSFTLLDYLFLPSGVLRGTISPSFSQFINVRLLIPYISLTFCTLNNIHHHLIQIVHFCSDIFTCCLPPPPFPENGHRRSPLPPLPLSEQP
ncbi:MAG: hypothetical protein PWQ91_1732, partial [Eubacteriales bacterium]|nr:hypothetical protein [Eubacteriales bacterium]